MDKDSLIEIIIKRVIEELSKNPSYNAQLTQPEELKTVVFLGNDNYLKEELKQYVNIVDNVDIRDSLSKLSKDININENNKLILSNLCINNLINLSQGKLNLVTEYLLNQGEVYLIEEGIEYKKYTEPKGLIKLYDTYLEQLKSFGINVVNRNDIVKILQKKDKMYLNGVITENKLKKLNLENKKIVLKENSKITSLAQDYLKQNNIEVCYERGQ